ncbi:arylacetamide deacetylase-like [Mercenaria mercenaria]|uniref:arylacetamide deacetylase-like n=1 Tax=Mercenaria mercenaria TaxID=6596 RepID=UPI00234EEEED|nr:arylacetamide deacetylase-like [Mercenaria mercenaria]
MALFIYKALLSIGVIVALAAFYARPVYPETASNRGLKTFNGLAFKFIGVLSYIGGYFGFSPLNSTRSMLNIITFMDKKSPNVERYTTTMDGVEVIVFKPAGHMDNLRPGIVHYHGGGWVFMSPDMYAALSEEVVEETGSVLVSVNYRLAPEHLYPIPLEDCLTATRYFLRHARDYGVDENLVGIKGDSAGGNLAMAVALKLSKEKDLPSLKFMSLDYPALQAFDFDLPCYKKYETGPGLLTKQAMIFYWLLYGFGHLEYYDMLYNNKHVNTELKNTIYATYVSKDLLPTSIRNENQDKTSEKTNDENNNEIKVPNEIIEKITDPLFAPLMASDDDLRLLPPTYIFNVEFDVLRDDGLIAAERLERVGVKVTKRFMSTEEHCYLNFVSLDKSIRQENIRFAKFLNETLKI